MRYCVANCAKFRCEYCRIHSDYMFLLFEVDPVIPIKHGGTNAVENLAFACPHCNQHKGLDFATILGDEIVRLLIPELINGQNILKQPMAKYTLNPESAKQA